MSIRVRAGDMDFRGFASDPVEGFYIEKDGWSGWDDGADMRRNSVERPQAVGRFAVKGYQDSRTVLMTGFCIAGSPPELGWMQSKLMSLYSDGLTHPVYVDDSGVTTMGVVSLSGQPKFRKLPDGVTAKYQIEFEMADPRKYGQSRTFGPAVTVTAHQLGNFPAAPVLTVTGTIGTGYTVNGPDSKTYTVVEPVTSGHPHTIDMATGLLSIDGALVFGAVTASDVWTVPGGTTISQTLVPVSGSGTLTVVVEDTFI